MQTNLSCSAKNEAPESHFRGFVCYFPWFYIGRKLAMIKIRPPQNMMAVE